MSSARLALLIWLSVPTVTARPPTPNARSTSATRSFVPVLSSASKPHQCAASLRCVLQAVSNVGMVSAPLLRTIALFSRPATVSNVPTELVLELPKPISALPSPNAPLTPLLNAGTAHAVRLSANALILTRALPTPVVVLTATVKLSVRTALRSKPVRRRSRSCVPT
mgnify:CR=1 FL=1